MRKSEFFKIIISILLNVVALFCGNNIFAQSKFINFKFGAVGSSPFNNSAPTKTISDIRVGLTIGVSYGYRFRNELLGIYGEIYYTGKGEKYELTDNQGGFNSFVCYFQAHPNVRIYIPSKGIYFGVGPYFGYAVTRDVTSGDLLDQSHYIKELEYYKKLDYGPRCSFGGEFGIGSINITTELAYEYGLYDISNRTARKITNQSLLLTIGTSFEITNKHYRHY